MKTQQVDPDAARRAARHILSDRRYHRDPAPKPLRGPLEWLGDRFQSIANWIADVLRPVPGLVWLVLALGIVAAVIARIVVIAKRRGVGPPSGGAAAFAFAFDADESEDPDELERLAVEAERAGDMARSVRLRFRAGLLRLGAKGVIEYRPSSTTTEVRRVIGSETFDDLARTFERIAYGGHDAGAPDVDEARRNWPRVLDEATRR
jgi:hypothetical protein